MTRNETASEPLRVAITGASGLIGRILSEHFQERGWQVLVLVRREPTAPHEIRWDPETGRVETAKLEGLEAVVHLAGASLAEGRWTKQRKRVLWDSRVAGTRSLAAVTRTLRAPPRVWVNASAIGYYGDCGQRTVTEADPAGEGFLAELCQAWEAEVAPISEVSRTVIARFGVVLSPKAGALAKMLPFFRLGLGGKIGSGRQFFSWVSPTDLARAVAFCIERKSVSGPVNLVGPNAVTNADFTAALGRCLGRPAVLPVPEFAVRVRFGEFATEALSSLRVAPAVLQNEGFEFEHPQVEQALRGVLD
jgi:hypothetical protein